VIDQDIWDLLVKLYTSYPNLKRANASDNQVCKVEEVLGMKLSDFYRYFLKNHAVSAIGKYNINTLSSSDDSMSTCPVVDATIKFRQEKQYPGSENYYIIANSDKGDLIAASTQGQIYIVRIDKNLPVKLAENFEEFLHNLLLKV